MRRSLALATCLSLGVALLPSYASRATVVEPRATSADGLAEHMEGLKTNLKGVAMALQGSDAETALRHLAEMQRIVLLAKLESPPNLDEQPEREREAHRAEFRKSLVRVLQELAGMELEILDGEYDKAFARVTGSLYTLRESSHDKFQRAE